MTDIDEDALVRGSAVSLTAASLPISLLSPSMEASPRVYEPKFLLGDITITSKHIMTRRIYDGHVKAHVQIVV